MACAALYCMWLRLVAPPTWAHVTLNKHPDLTSPGCVLPAVRGLSCQRPASLLGLEGPWDAPASHPPLPVYRWQKGVPRAENHPRSLSTGHITFEEDKSSISPFIGCIYAGRQALPELLDLHGVTLLHPVIAQAPEPAILGVKEERKRHSL